jgi:hypothetical protein
VKYLKHLKHRLATCVFCHCNVKTRHLKQMSEMPETLESICNIQIYFCNVQMKHLKQKSKTHETLET